MICTPVLGLMLKLALAAIVPGPPGGAHAGVPAAVAQAAPAAALPDGLPPELGRRILERMARRPIEPGWLDGHLRRMAAARAAIDRTAGLLRLMQIKPAADIPGLVAAGRVPEAQAIVESALAKPPEFEQQRFWLSYLSGLLHLIEQDDGSAAARFAEAGAIEWRRPAGRRRLSATDLHLTTLFRLGMERRNPALLREAVDLVADVHTRPLSAAERALLQGVRFEAATSLLWLSEHEWLGTDSRRRQAIASLRALLAEPELPPRQAVLARASLAAALLGQSRGLPAPEAVDEAAAQLRLAVKTVEERRLPGMIDGMREALITVQATKARAGGRAGDWAAVEAEIARLDPAGQARMAGLRARARLEAAMQAGDETARAAAAAAVRARFRDLPGAQIEARLRLAWLLLRAAERRP